MLCDFGLGVETGLLVVLVREAVLRLIQGNILRGRLRSVNNVTQPQLCSLFWPGLLRDAFSNELLVVVFHLLRILYVDNRHFLGRLLLYLLLNFQVLIGVLNGYDLLGGVVVEAAAVVLVEELSSLNLVCQPGRHSLLRLQIIIDHHRSIYQSKLIIIHSNRPRIHSGNICFCTVGQVG